MDEKVRQWHQRIESYLATGEALARELWAVDLPITRDWIRAARDRMESVADALHNALAPATAAPQGVIEVLPD